jgi:hypothetical protein
LASTIVLLADLPPMLEDMVSRVLKGRSDLEVVRGSSTGSRVISSAVATGAPVVVVARSDPADLASIDPYLAEASNVSVVAVALDGASACTHEFKPTRQAIDDVSAEQILTAISDAATRRGR